jgi:peroxiredoxin Q/BCP
MNRLATLGLLSALSFGACSSEKHANEAPSKHELVAVGSEVPSLVRMDQKGQVVSLRSTTPTLVYFYPKDGTPGCTKEACAFRDAWQSYQEAGLRVIGVSSDSEKDHRAFAEEHGLPYSLVSDPEHVWSDAFGVGTFMGLDSRVSFLIDGAGKVVKAYRDVDPGVHAKEVLADAQALGLVKRQAAAPTDSAPAPSP